MLEQLVNGIGYGYGDGDGDGYGDGIGDGIGDGRGDGHAHGDGYGDGDGYGGVDSPILCAVDDDLRCDVVNELVRMEKPNKEGANK